MAPREVRSQLIRVPRDAATNGKVQGVAAFLGTRGREDDGSAGSAELSDPRPEGRGYKWDVQGVAAFLGTRGRGNAATHSTPRRCLSRGAWVLSVSGAVARRLGG
jgi:hypothetical protein